MGVRIEGHAYPRLTNLGSEIEAFIDDNLDEFSVNQIKLLEDLADQIDVEAFKINEKVEGLEERIKEMKGDN